MTDERFCICEYSGADGTRSHDDIAAEIVNPTYPTYKKCFACYNHLYVYKQYGFRIRMLTPTQSKFELGESL